MEIEDVVSSKFNISREKIRRIKKLIEELQEIPREVVLVGGTAINLVYFGKMQRISYDIDLETEKRAKLRNEFSKKYKKIAFTRRMDIFEKDGLKIDIMDFLGGKIVEKSIESIFTLSGIPFYLKVRTLEFEELLARKLIALSRRGTAKDLYDCYVGIMIEHDMSKVRKAIRRMDKDFLVPARKYVDRDLSKIDSLVFEGNGEDAFSFVKSYLENLDIL